MRVAVVLFNLGGPGSLNDVEPFLFNLFNDPAIIRVPSPFRYLLARLISTGSLLDKGYLFWDEPESKPVTCSPRLTGAQASSR